MQNDLTHEPLITHESTSYSAPDHLHKINLPKSTPVDCGPIARSERSVRRQNISALPLIVLSSSSLSDLPALERACIVAPFAVPSERALMSIVVPMTSMTSCRHLDSRDHRPIVAGIAMKSFVSPIQHEIGLHIVIKLP